MKIKFILIIWVLSFVACKDEPKPVVNKSQFVELTATESGIDFNNELKPNTNINILEYLYYYNGGGVAVGDLNKDGLEDLVFTGNQSMDRLYINKGGLLFEDKTLESGLSDQLDWSSGVTMDDIDNDGDLDIYICKVSPLMAEATHNLLYLNDGTGQFTESSQKLGLDFSGYSTQASFFDYDRDGDLDMYLLNHSVHSVRSYGKIEKRTVRSELAGDRLFENKLNEGEGRFVDVTENSGIYSSALGYGLGVVTADINQDGWTDVYVGNDFHENDYIYLNQGDGTFRESMSEMLNHSSKFSMGVDIADMNQDGLPDVFTTDMLPYQKEVAMKSGGEDTDQVFEIRNDFGYEYQYARNHFQLQFEDHEFTDVALMTETYATDWSWSVLLQDYDNNGLKDIFISNGIVKRPNDLDYINYINNQSEALSDGVTAEELKQVLDLMPSEKLQNILFSQTEFMEFSKVKESQIGKPSFSNGASYADLDLDGDLDLVLNNINATASILENKSATGHHYVGVQLNDPIGQKTLKGTKVRVVTGEGSFSSEYQTTRGYQSSVSHTLHFGLGKTDKILQIEVIWPDQSVETFKDIAIDKVHLLDKGKSLAKYQYENPKSNYTVSKFQNFHIENDYKDYNADKLIPEILSNEGPALVSADFNQDGILDVFIGGARFQVPKLFLGQNDGSYKVRANKDFELDKKYEDVDAAIIDFDNDGDPDLYVVSGGNDFKELDKSLEDRLYLNDGKGNLQRLPLSLPHTNGSTVSVADIDQDGFEDIFVGARSIPGSYGLSPFSFILKNKGGFGVDIVSKSRYGMLTDSQWIDIDQDKDLDLILCGDWMPITVIENLGEGKFDYKKEQMGFSGLSGLWNTLAFHDFNGDGQMDVLAGNAGSNLKWKASGEEPVTMSVIDMDQNAQTEPLIFHSYFGEYKPFVSFDRLREQVPSIRKQFLNYAEFSKVSELTDFDQVKTDQIAERKTLTELRSMIFLSTNGSYEAIPLPDLAQLSAIQDFEVDGNGELYFVGNNGSFLTELGKSLGMSGGKLSGYDVEGKRFQESEKLPLEKGLDYKGIVELGTGKYLVVVNGVGGYVLEHIEMGNKFK